MAVINWSPSAWQLYNDYLENAQLEFGRKTALRWERELLAIDERPRTYPESYPIEETLRRRKRIYRRCHMMKRRFKLICFYDAANDVVFSLTFGIHDKVRRP